MRQMPYWTRTVIWSRNTRALSSFNKKIRGSGSSNLVRRSLKMESKSICGRENRRTHLLMSCFARLSSKEFNPRRWSIISWTRSRWTKSKRPKSWKLLQTTKFNTGGWNCLWCQDERACPDSRSLTKKTANSSWWAAATILMPLTTRGLSRSFTTREASWN